MSLEAALQRAWRLVQRRSSPVASAVERSSLPRAVVPALLTGRPARFAGHELLGRRRLREHGLRGGRWRFCVHHGTADASVLAEIFRAGYYELPPAVDARFRELGRPLRAADLGAHVGLFAVWVAKHFPSARILLVEPDPQNLEALHCTIRANGARTRAWQVVEACAAPEPGVLPFAAGASSSSRALDAPMPGSISVPAVDVFPLVDDADLLKIDIEGGEWALLADERFRRIPAALVFLEYHRHLCPEDDPRVRAVELLEAAGYRTMEVFRADGVGLIRGERLDP